MIAIAARASAHNPLTLGPPTVAAFATRLTAESTNLTLVNLGSKHRRMAVQAGGMGEHEFTEAAADGACHRIAVNGATL